MNTVGLNCLTMEEYLTKRIKELEDEQIKAINSGEAELATKLCFAVCELMDAKNEYRKIQLSK